MSIWHEKALEYDAQGLSRREVTNRIEAEFGLTGMYKTVCSYIFKTHRRAKKNEVKNFSVKVGDKVKFDHFKDIKIAGMAMGVHEVIGEVIDIHEDHRWFSVKYFLGDDTPIRTSFSFVDIGEKVFPCN